MTPFTLTDFDYYLPPALIAQHPTPCREDSRLMVVDRASQTWAHRKFSELPQILEPRDFLVLNNTRVFPARLHGRKASGGRVELLLHHPPQPLRLNQNPNEARVQASYRGHRLKVGQVLDFASGLQGEITALVEPGVAAILFRTPQGDVCQAIYDQGQVPLPPYIRRAPEQPDQERYQTVYACQAGAIAAPTAGLHFTPGLLDSLKARGVETAFITLHVGTGTFLPVRTSDYTQHRMQPEYFMMSADTAQRLNRAQAAGKRLIAVGTTSVRVLEHCAGPQGFTPQEGWCDLFIYPGHRFQAVDRLLTNFHLPRSTLLLLVAAFAGRDLILAAYQDAIHQHYRFYSYGDCMLIL